MQLDVRVRGKTVASLYREKDEYVLKYLPGTSEADFVSLVMPVREEPWRWPRDLHPFFRQNLPEGYLLNIIREEFGPLLDGTDLSLLAVVGGMGIGRVTVTPEDAPPVGELEPLEIEKLLTADDSTENFAKLVRRYARAAISGAVPKFLAPETAAQGDTSMARTSVRTSRHIIKGSDESTPYLGLNEHYSMRVLERLDVVPVARTRMSANGHVLIVDRFDIDEGGVPTYGLEDSCSLLGLPPYEKYRPSMESVLRATQAYLPTGTTYAQSRHLGWQILHSYVVRNADLHSKNVALYYNTVSDVAYTPVYDVVTVQAYKRFADNSPALSIEGRKTWAPKRSLETFFKARLGIPPSEYREMVGRVCESAVEVGKELAAAARNEKRWDDVSTQMLHAWDEGMRTLRETLPSGKRSVTRP